MYIPTVAGIVIMVKTIQSHNLPFRFCIKGDGWGWCTIWLKIIYGKSRFAEASPWIMLSPPCLTTYHRLPTSSLRTRLSKVAVKIQSNQVIPCVDVEFLEQEINGLRCCVLNMEHSEYGFIASHGLGGTSLVTLRDLRRRYQRSNISSATPLHHQFLGMSLSVSLW